MISNKLTKRIEIKQRQINDLLKLIVWMIPDDFILSKVGELLEGDLVSRQKVWEELDEYIRNK